jgi:cell division protein FtsB
MKFKPEHHIVGKVYDLTQENMNAMIAVFEEQKKENEQLREALEMLSKENAGFCCDCPDIQEYARSALDGKLLGNSR